jgi:predicted 3-demethylubiquinone-9 3-methyltransferase (glyoxalase superfamily)
LPGNIPLSLPVDIPSSPSVGRRCGKVASRTVKRRGVATGARAHRGTGRELHGNKIITCLGFNHQAEEAVKFYASVFGNSKILSTRRYGEAGPGPKGSLLVARFTLDGQEFMALNGGPSFTFAPGISLLVNCESQAEIDDLWERLSEGGNKGPCGWLTDKFGLSWQIVPSVLQEMMGDPDVERSERVMEALLKMGKIDIKTLKQAYDQR